MAITLPAPAGPSISTRTVRGLLHHRAVMVLLLALAGCTVDTPTLSDLPPGLFGVVTSARTGARVNGATVKVQGLTVVSDSNGIYSVANLRKETSLVEVSHPDYVNAERRVAIDRLLSPGDFKLEPKASDIDAR